MNNNTYQGWYNYHTWNVALFINNEYRLYKAACSYVSYQTELGLDISYEEFTRYFKDQLGDVTPDGVSWSDPTLDTDELTEMLQELV